MSKAQQGDDEAFLTLFQKYETDIYRIAFLYVKNKDDALDIVQETAYRSFMKVGSLKNPQFFKTWLIKIAKSCAIDLLRKQKKVIHLTPENTGLEASKKDDLPLTLSLQDLLNTLSETEKTIILWRFYYGYTLQEIADIEQTPLGTVKSLLYRALSKLQRQVRRVDMYE
ncbi:sigma-70 family RNA polymerase sigma factor [Oceanobacillus kapialis]|uniref:Sigma-70 family RNA polymerase sigma factor n=1 Tax=Oceanobacillus kapialis TaxID=481353 RepID=A0ABW5Q3K1_9BACI